MGSHAVPPSVAVPDGPAVTRTRRGLLAVTGAVVAVTAALAAAVVVPYLVNDLHRLPLAEVASGAHDPKDLWPRGAAAGWSQLLGLLAVLLVLPGAVAGAALSVATLQQCSWAPRDVRGLAAAGALLLVSAALLVACLSPLGPALASWRLD